MRLEVRLNQRIDVTSRPAEVARGQDKHSLVKKKVGLRGSDWVVLDGQAPRFRHRRPAPACSLPKIAAEEVTLRRGKRGAPCVFRDDIFGIHTVQAHVLMTFVTSGTRASPPAPFGECVENLYFWGIHPPW